MKKGFLLSSISGVLLVLSDAGVGWFPLVWIAIVPFLIAIKGAKNIKSVFLMGNHEQMMVECCKLALFTSCRRLTDP